MFQALSANDDSYKYLLDLLNNQNLFIINVSTEKRSANADPRNGIGTASRPNYEIHECHWHTTLAAVSRRQEQLSN